MSGYLGHIADPRVKPEWGAQLNPEHPLSLGLYAQWPMLEGNGATTGNLIRGNPLNFNNSSVAWAPGPDGPAVSLPGTAGSYLQTANAIFDPAAGDFTAAIWFNVAAAGSGPTLMGQPSGTGTGANWLWINTNNKLATSLFGGTATILQNIVSAGAWHLAALTFQLATTTVTIYLDNAGSLSASRTPASNVAVLRVGSGSIGQLNGLIGKAGVTLWQRALGPGEVLRLYQEPYADLALLSNRRFYYAAAAGGGGIAPGVLMYHHRRRRAG